MPYPWFLISLKHKLTSPFYNKMSKFESSMLLSPGTKEATASGLPETVATIFLSKSVFPVFCSSKKKAVMTNHLEPWGLPPISLRKRLGLWLSSIGHLHDLGWVFLTHLSAGCQHCAFPRKIKKSRLILFLCSKWVLEHATFTLGVATYLPVVL